MPTSVSPELEASSPSNNRIERLQLVIDALTQSFPANHTSALVIIGPRQVHRLWMHAAGSIRSGRPLIYVEPAKFGELVSRLDEQCVFITDEVDPSLRPQLLLDLKKLDMSLGHRMFLTSVEPVPDTNGISPTIQSVLKG